MKQRSLAKIEEFVNTCPRLYEDVHFTGRINMLRDKCNKDVFNPNELLKFKEFTIMLDNHRGQTLETVNPELYKLIQELYWIVLISRITAYFVCTRGLRRLKTH